MSEPVLTAHEVLNWNEKTSNQWRKFLAANPDVLAIPCDVAGTKTVAEFLQHIVAVELRWAERIAHLPETTYEQVPYDSIDNLYATHDKAIAILKQTLAANTDWNQSIEFVTRTYGPASSTAKTMYFHALLHSIRHYAQLGTLLRQNGYNLNWLGDYLAMGWSRLSEH
jgi:uncharacterized damage-inducible protein DinB